jgi:hypothetical protein
MTSAFLVVIGFKADIAVNGLYFRQPSSPFCFDLLLNAGGQGSNLVAK